MTKLRTALDAANTKFRTGLATALLALEEELDEEGWTGTTVDALAEKLGVSTQAARTLDRILDKELMLWLVERTKVLYQERRREIERGELKIFVRGPQGRFVYSEEKTKRAYSEEAAKAYEEGVRQYLASTPNVATTD
jgi:AcrR family transcriptional regulator